MKCLWNWGVEECLEEAALRTQPDITIERNVSKASFLSLNVEDKDDINIEALKVLSTASVIVSVTNYLNKRDAIGIIIIIIN